MRKGQREKIRMNQINQKRKTQKEKNAERIKFNNSGQIKGEGVDKAKD